jgi:hypothetical protein
LRQEAAELELNLTQGSLFFNIAQPLDAEETLNIRTSTMVIGIRGTSGIVHASQAGIPDGIFVLDGSVTLLYEGKEITVSAKHKAELIDDSGESSIQITELTETEIEKFAVEEIRKDAALQKRLENAGWDVDRILNVRSPETIAMYAAYLDAIEKYGTVQSQFNVPALVTGGGLLDFNSDGFEDLVLFYNSELEGICSTYTYELGSIQELFTLSFEIGATDYAVIRTIYENNGKACIVAAYPLDWSWYDTLSDEEHEKIPNFQGRGFEIFQNGEIQEKLYYGFNPELNTSDYSLVDHIEWEIWRDGAQTQKGNVPSAQSEMPEIEAVIIEAEETYGTPWTWMPIEELKAFLAN